MEPTLQESASARAAFDQFILDAGLLQDESLSKTSLEILYGVFWHGVAYGISTQSHKAPESSQNAFKRQAENGQSYTLKDPDGQASSAQYNFLKALSHGEGARQLMSPLEADALYQNKGTLTKGEASSLIDRLIKAGVKPKKSK